MLELPRKFEDQRPLVLNCKIGGIPFDKTLCDTWASVFMMYFSCFLRLSFKEKKGVESFDYNIKLVDNNSKTPMGIIKD